MPSPKTFVFDIDDTVADLLSVVAGYLKKTLPNFHPSHIQHRETFKLLNIELSDWFQIMQDEKMLFPENLKPKPGVELLQHLVDQGHNVEFLTARAWHKDAQALSEEWLRVHAGLRNPKVHVVMLHESKADYMLKNNLIADHFADDVPQYCAEVLQKGAAKEAICIHMPWIDQVSKDDLKLMRVAKSLECLHSEHGLISNTYSGHF